MLEIDETTLNAINSAIDEILSLVAEKKDIRIITARLPKVSNTIRAAAEIRETPDNRFISYIVNHFLLDIRYRFENQKEEWFRLNKEVIDASVLQLKNLLIGLKSSLNNKSFEKTIDVIKMFVFAYWQTVLALAG